MSEIRKYINLIESYERLNEVRVITRKESEPLKDTDSILVYHGTSSTELVKQWITKGLTGDTKANRTYSYEFNNNPKGLFVTPDLDTAKEFGTLIIEFHASVSDLESPVWPNGTFTGQGQMSGRFDSEEEREEERQRIRKQHNQSEDDVIKNSDRPELAVILISGGERQALFIGDLNPHFVKAVWIKDEPDKSKSTYTRFSPKEFIRLLKQDKLSNFRYNRGGLSDDDKNDLVINPREFLSGEEFIQRIINSYPERMRQTLTHEKVKSIFTKEPMSLRKEVWSDRQFKHYKKELGISESMIYEDLSIFEAGMDFLTVYHGSDHKIEKFNLDWLADGNHQHGIGIYFTTRPETTKFYGKYTYKVLLDREFKLVPKRKPNKTLATKLIKKAPELDDVIENWDENKSVALRKAVDSMVEFTDSLEDMIDQIWYDFYRDYPKEYLHNLVSITGFDGKVIDYEDQKFLVLYNPEKIEKISIYSE